MAKDLTAVLPPPRRACAEPDRDLAAGPPEPPPGAALSMSGRRSARPHPRDDRRRPALYDDENPNDPADHFLGEGLITEVIRIVKTGKEASVHLCRANRSTTGEELLALKVYHPLDRRDFRDESLYRDGEWIKERRVRVALEKRTKFGRHIQSEVWVGREWEMLDSLSEVGVCRPAPDRALGRRDPDDLHRRRGRSRAAAPLGAPVTGRGAGPPRPGRRCDRIDAVPQRRPRRPLGVQRPRLGRPHHGDRPASGGRPPEEPPRSGPPRARRRPHLRRTSQRYGATGSPQRDRREPLHRSGSTPT